MNRAPTNTDAWTGDIEKRVRGLEARTLRSEEMLLTVRAEVSSKRLGVAFWLPVLFSVVTSLVGVGYLAGKYADRAEVIDIVHKSSPYLRDERKIERVVDRYDADQKEIRNSLSKIESDLSAIRAGLAAKPKRRR